MASRNKRQIPGKRVFNSANVFSDFVPSNQTPTSFYRDTFAQAKTEKQVQPAGLVNKPDPNSVCFLYENPRFVNEPICFANTKATHCSQSVISETKISAPYKSDSVNRSDYKHIQDRPLRATRFGSNPHHINCAKGIVPNNDNSGTSNERISFEHGFDCRTGRKERGKLHGSFVWDTRQGLHACRQRRNDRLLGNS